MRISLYNGSTLYPLAGQAGVSERVHSSAGDFQLTPQSASELVEYVRGSHAKPIDRGNLLHVMAFSTSRLFASVHAAQLWALDYDADFPRTGTVYFEALSPTGVGYRRSMANAVIDPPRRRVIGASVLLDYTIRGGALSDEASTAPLVVSGVTAPEEMNGSLLEDFAETNGRRAWRRVAGTTTTRCYWTGTAWWLSYSDSASPPDGLFISTDDVLLPTLVTTWTPNDWETGTPAFTLEA